MNRLKGRKAAIVGLASELILGAAVRSLKEICGRSRTVLLLFSIVFAQGQVPSITKTTQFFSSDRHSLEGVTRNIRRAGSGIKHDALILRIIQERLDFRMMIEVLARADADVRVFDAEMSHPRRTDGSSSFQRMLKNHKADGGAHDLNVGTIAGLARGHTAKAELPGHVPTLSGFGLAGKSLQNVVQGLFDLSGTFTRVRNIRDRDPAPDQFSALRVDEVQVNGTLILFHDPLHGLFAPIGVERFWIVAGLDFGFPGRSDGVGDFQLRVLASRTSPCLLR